MTLPVIMAFAAAALGAVLAIFPLLRRRSVARGAFSAGMLVLAAECLCDGLAQLATTDAEILAWQNRRHLALACIPAPWLLFSLVYSRDNIGRLIRAWWLPLGLFSAAPLALAGWGFLDGFARVELDSHTNASVIAVMRPGLGLHVIVLIASVLVLANIERTYRAATGTIRWRIKYAVLGTAVLFGVRLYLSSQTLLFQELGLGLSEFRSAALLIAALLYVRAMLRSGHFEMTVYPSRALLQNSLTVVLVGVYLLVVGVLAQAVSWLGGDSGFALKAFFLLVALTALAILLQSDRAQLRLRRFVSRHLQRPHYDYRTLWIRFAESTASRRDERELAQAIVTLTSEVFQALSVTLWLLDRERQTLQVYGSTFGTPERWPELEIASGTVPDLLRFLAQHPAIVDVDASQAPELAALRDGHPSQFPHGGHRVCAPIILREHVIGLILLGDRVGGARFSDEDFDLIKCLANHAAAGLANLALARQLGQTREIAAFQTMATFLVHDLKNATSTLNLMLKNLPVHFDNPEFRADALRGIEKTVANMNQLTGRLGRMRQELTIQPVENVDLNAIVERALAGCPAAHGLVIEKQLQPMPLTLLDPEQIGKVVTNLLLNGIEAMSGVGRLCVTTQADDSWLRLSVADTGCGISPEFLRESLFQPFRTTKKGGMGIGMFQTRTIIDAHRGRITVESVVGHGTTFHVYLPRVAPVPLTK